jgi:transcriptional regulator with XRE-family HTH domain
MTPNKIIYLLKEKGVAQKDIAAELGIWPINVSNVIHRKIVSDRVMKKIAEKLGCNYWDVFPEYYKQKPKRRTSKTLERFVVPEPKPKSEEGGVKPRPDVQAA